MIADASFKLLHESGPVFLTIIDRPFTKKKKNAMKITHRFIPKKEKQNHKPTSKFIWKSDV